MYKCKFCKKEFKREKTLAVHMCPKKQRWVQRDERYVQIAFACWLQFMDITAHKKKNGYTYEDFMNSSLYIGFIKHARNAMLLNILDIGDFTNFCIESGYKLQNWTKKYCYEAYMKQLTVKETPERAITRSMKIMERWAEDNSKDIITFFTDISPNEAVYMITSGKISPWMIFCSSKSSHLLERFSPEQMGMINEFVDFGRWKIRINKYREEYDHISIVLAEAGI